MKINRRQFNASLAGVAVSGFCTRSVWAVTKASTPQPKKVLVVGGGISGLYAADILKTSGYSVQVLEAASRVGGRVLGKEIGGQKFDVGGQAFTKDMRRVKALGKRFGLHAIHKPQQRGFFLRNDNLLVGAELDRIVQEVDDVLAKTEVLARRLGEPGGRNDLASQSVMDWIHPKLSSVSQEYFRTSFSAEYCATPENVSLLHFVEANRGYRGDEDEMALRYREGMFTIVDELYRNIQMDVRLNHPVEEINCTSSGVVATAGGSSFYADYLILAIPLPQLRRLKICGLDDQTLRSSLAGYQGAAVRKIIAVYDDPFWKDRPREGDICPPVGLSLMDNSDLEKRVYSLVMFLGGPIANQGVDQTKALSLVARVLGSNALRPIAYHEQAWLPEAFLSGGYGSIRGPRLNKGEILPKQIGRVFLAGSDSSDQFSGYIEGALASGERAVNGILALVKSGFRG
jgi:monoamine oxidase